MNRKTKNIWSAAIAAPLALAACHAGDSSPTAPAQELFFVGSGRANIESFRLDVASGALTPLGPAAQMPHPSFLALAPNRHFLYAISEGHTKDDSGVRAFSVDPETGKLTLLNTQPAGGAGPCYIEVDASGRNVLIANYGSGSVAVFPLDSNGALRPASAFVQDEGSSINPARQKGPHAHCIVTDPKNRFAAVCDLGTDKVMIFNFDPDQGTLLPGQPAFNSVKPGSGPRHIVFYPDGRWAYVINEMASTVTAFACDPQGSMRELQTLSILPPDFSGVNTAAEIELSPSGKFLYCSNRGDNSFAVFQCDPATGLLAFVQRVPTGGKIPRNFQIDPTGRFLVAANQDSNTIVVFSIDSETGRLQPTGAEAKTDQPMCVKFY